MFSLNDLCHFIEQSIITTFVLDIGLCLMLAIVATMVWSWISFHHSNNTHFNDTIYSTGLFVSCCDIIWRKIMYVSTFILWIEKLQHPNLQQHWITCFLSYSHGMYKSRSPALYLIKGNSVGHNSDLAINTAQVTSCGFINKVVSLCFKAKNSTETVINNMVTAAVHQRISTYFINQQ